MPSPWAKTPTTTQAGKSPHPGKPPQPPTKTRRAARRGRVNSKDGVVNPGHQRRLFGQRTSQPDSSPIECS